MNSSNSKQNVAHIPKHHLKHSLYLSAFSKHLNCFSILDGRSSITCKIYIRLLGTRRLRKRSAWSRKSHGYHAVKPSKEDICCYQNTWLINLFLRFISDLFKRSITGVKHSFVHCQCLISIALPNLQKFKYCAYGSTIKKDLVDGLDTFMEDSLVLPTGQHYEEDTLMPILQRIMKKGKEVKENEERMKRGIFDFLLLMHYFIHG